MRHGAASLGAAVALALGGSGADAAHPGLNGLIAYDFAWLDSEPIRILAVRPDGSGIRQLTASRRRARSPAWAPDGAALAYVAARGEDAGPLVVIEAGRAPHRVARLVHEKPAWSPDGAQIAFLEFGALRIARTDGRGSARRVEVHGLEDLYNVAWSPDGGLIAFTAFVSFEHDACCIMVVPSSGGETRMLVQEPLRTTAEHPIWSPDGRTVAFTEIENCRGRTCSGPTHVVLVSRDGRTRRRLLERAWVHAWSPDGRFLLVGLRDGERGLYTFRLSDGRIRHIVRAENLNSADWQPRCSVHGNGPGNRVRGGAGNDVICGHAGSDDLVGGPGQDRLFGRRGDDTIDTADDAFDVVGCGPGRDVVVADRRDRTGVDCEVVTRR